MGPESDVYFSFFKGMKFARIPKEYYVLKALKIIGALSLTAIIVPIALMNRSDRPVYSLVTIILMAIGYPTYIYALKKESEMMKRIEAEAMEEAPDDEKFLVIIDYGILKKTYVMTHDELDDLQYLLSDFKKNS